MPRIALTLCMLLAACGDSAGSVPSSTTSTDQPVATSTTATTTTSTSEPDRAIVLAVVSGRGDDLTFEVGVWVDGDAAAVSPVLVGIDADDSYPGVGDPTSHLEGWVLLDGSIEVGAAGEVVAGGNATAVSHWVSVAVAGNAMRIFFIGEVAPVAGSVWVVLGDGSGPGSVAGVTTGQGCSARESVLMVTVAGDVPDPGAPCRYPDAS